MENFRWWFHLLILNCDVCVLCCENFNYVVGVAIVQQVVVDSRVIDLLQWGRSPWLIGSKWGPPLISVNLSTRTFDAQIITNWKFNTMLFMQSMHYILLYDIESIIHSLTTRKKNRKRFFFSNSWRFKSYIRSQTSKKNFQKGRTKHAKIILLHLCQSNAHISVVVSKFMGRGP